MKKIKNNNKGFTLIELLAVIVILAILVMVAIPAVTKYLEIARKGTFSDAAATAISAVRTSYIADGKTGTETYDKTQINALLEKKLNKSPFGNQYGEKINVTVTPGETSDVITYHICLDDGQYVINQDEDNLDKDKVVKIDNTNKKCG